MAFLGRVACGTSASSYFLENSSDAGHPQYANSRSGNPQGLNMTHTQTLTISSSLLSLLQGALGMVLRFVFVLLMFIPDAQAQRDHFVSLYTGRFSNNALNEIIRFESRFEDSYVFVLSGGKQISRYKDLIGFELEGQLGIHSGDQSHAELNGAFTIRWIKFPWDRYLNTSFAFGNGLSYAFEKPPLEMRESDDGDTSKLLYYILVEWAFALPKEPQWELFLRAHHRSSVFGLFDGLFAASNYGGVGIRYRF
jgi:hypothetical protein